ncbi:TolC family protein [Sphingobacterium sp. lm-10]|uniref:TolC family protein n=1 Tax=Sphingobacterium sp. lm-10 TaxID=2944904 RepID=UPI00201FE54A|nr:TolC family protein [Sphingobacterium sp. lm-10]MCL7986599.1 TolC family protein [Sphingobacterium sp. lm-10]
MTTALSILDRRNIDIQNLKHQTTLARQEVKDAKNALLPKLNLGLSHNYNFGLAFDQIAGQLITGNRWTNFANANIGTQVVIFKGFELQNQIRNAVLNLESNYLELKSLNRSSKLQLLQIYFTAITNRALLESGLNQLDFSKEQLQLQREQFEMGVKTLVDVSLAESQVATNELNALTSKNNYINSLIDLKQLLNISYTDSIELEIPENSIENLYITDTSNSNESLAQNPLIAIANINLTKAELVQKIAKNRYMPTISFSGGYGTNYSSERVDFQTGNFMPFLNQVNQNRSLNLGLSLSVPIFDGFQVRSAKNKADINILIQKNEIEKVKMEQEKIFQKSLQEYHRSIQEYNVSKKQLKSLKTSLDALSERYELGLASPVDFSKALLDHNLSEFKVITSKYNAMYYNEIIKVLNSSS